MATTEPQAAPPETATDPTPGTPPAATPVPAEATPQSPAPTVDWEARYRAIQPELTRQQQARAAAERERDALKSAQPEDDEEVLTPARPARRNSEASDEWQRRALDAEWQIARSVHGDEVIAAYEVAAGLLNSAATPADSVNAFEAYFQARAKGMTHREAVAEVAPAAPEPVVDSNRSDAPASAEVDQKLREAVEKKDLLGGIQAMLRRG